MLAASGWLPRDPVPAGLPPRRLLKTRKYRRQQR